MHKFLELKHNEHDEASNLIFTSEEKKGLEKKKKNPRKLGTGKDEKRD